MLRKIKIRLKTILLGAGLILAAGFLIYCILKLVEPSSPPQNVIVSNITDHQATISWVTQKPTRGEIVVSEDGKFPLLPIFAKVVYRDDGEKKLKRPSFYTTHFVTINNLEPDKTYKFRIYQDWKKKIQGNFSTGLTLPSISAPNPVYGRVLSADKKPIVGALIYLQVKRESTASALLSAMTNKEGRWSMDLGNLRNLNLKKLFKLNGKITEQIIVEAGPKGRVKAETSINQDNPWPDIILK